MDVFIYIDIQSMRLFILHFKGSHVKFSKFWCISVPEGFLFLANSAGLHCWLKYPLRGLQYRPVYKGLSVQIFLIGSKILIVLANDILVLILIASSQGSDESAHVLTWKNNLTENF